LPAPVRSSFSPCLNRSARSSFTSSLAPRIANLRSNLVRVGGVVDHVHIFMTLPQTVSQAQLVEQIKKTLSKSLPSAPPPHPASGERIEGRGIRTFRKTR